MPTRAAAVRELPRQQRNNCGGRSSTPSSQVSQIDGRKEPPTGFYLFVRAARPDSSVRLS